MAAIVASELLALQYQVGLEALWAAKKSGKIHAAMILASPRVSHALTRKNTFCDSSRCNPAPPAVRGGSAPRMKAPVSAGSGFHHGLPGLRTLGIGLLLDFEMHLQTYVTAFRQNLHGVLAREAEFSLELIASWLGAGNCGHAMTNRVGVGKHHH